MKFGRLKVRLFLPNSDLERPVAADVASARQFNWINFPGHIIDQNRIRGFPTRSHTRGVEEHEVHSQSDPYPRGVARRAWRKANLCFSKQIGPPRTLCLELPETRTCINSRHLGRLIANRYFSLQRGSGWCQLLVVQLSRLFFFGRPPDNHARPAAKANNVSTYSM
jgi:hypothetical protein